MYADKNLFLREGWRYELESEDSPLNINGIVYNEMKGSLGNITSAALSNVNDALFPNSILSNISGGVPEKMSSLTYEQLIETYKKYYHPSNSLMVLYGNVDYTKFLKLINDRREHARRLAAPAKLRKIRACMTQLYPLDKGCVMVYLVPSSATLRM